MTEETKENESGCNNGSCHVKNEDTTSAFKCKAITAVASVALYIMFFQLDIISAQIAIGFDIPVHNTSIYLEKLFGIRFLTFFFGRVTEYIIFRTYSKVETDDDKKRQMRADMNIAAFGVLLLGRIILFLVTCFSSNPGYHVYFALAFEAFGIGCSGAAFCSTYPRHCTVIILFAHVSRLVTFFVQFILDRAFKNSMPKIKFQFFFCTLLNIAAVIGLYQYQHGETGCNEHKTLAKAEKVLEDKQKKENAEKRPEVHGPQEPAPTTPKEPAPTTPKEEILELGFIKTFGRAASPFFMYSAGSLFFDTLFPGILPYAFDTRERCHMINMSVPFAGVTGTILLVGLESANIYQRWLPVLDAAWLIAIPMAIVFVYSILAVHTRIPSARKIIKNRPRILAMTFTGALGNSFMDPLSFSGVIKVLFLSGFKPDVEVLLLHEITCILVRFYHYKISVGYNVTRINLGYILPRFRPNHRMSKWNTFWYILREMFRKALRDAISDLTMNVKEYL